LLGSTAERVIRKAATPVLVVDSRGAGPYRRPLVAVDGSETSRRAFELALGVAGSAESIDVVHAYGGGAQVKPVYHRHALFDWRA